MMQQFNFNASALQNEGQKDLYLWVLLLPSSYPLAERTNHFLLCFVLLWGILASSAAVLCWEKFSPSMVASRCSTALTECLSKSFPKNEIRTVESKTEKGFLILPQKQRLNWWSPGCTGDLYELCQGICKTD